MDHPALPSLSARPWLLTAGAVWAASALPRQGWVGSLVAVFVALLVGWRLGAGPALIVVLAMVAGLMSVRAPEPLPPGQLSIQATIGSSVVHGRFGDWVLAETRGGPVLVDLPPRSTATRGSVVSITGVSDGQPGESRGVAYRAVIKAEQIFEQKQPGVLHRIGAVIRARVMASLEPFDSARGLVAGFLIGDTSRVDEVDQTAMKRAGLSHFTAVSGSNVALFLVLLFALTLPLSMTPVGRSIVGLAGIPVYAAATGFEPSVMRASAMAALVLGGRLAGIVLDAWQVLSVAVIGLLLVDPALTSNLGFQLSVAATAGVMIGARWPIHHGRVFRALTITIGAQLAVAPLLISYFGTVPVASPLANLVAAPLVASATGLGAIGVAIMPFLIPVAAFTCSLVLNVAHSVSNWPQVGAVGLIGLALGGLAIWWRPQLRGLAALIGATALVLVTCFGSSPPPEGSVVVLDVGQGDAILLAGGKGHYALVDGGPDATLILDKLRSMGVDRVDLLVATHVHADHVTGLTSVVRRIPVEEAWMALDPHETPASAEFRESLAQRGIPFSTPRPGSQLRLGSLILRVEGPLRRYASPNDQSIVLTVVGPSRSMLLTGDIEVIAQAELFGLRADVLKVPHQGAATSDPSWLRSVGARVAVISVGPNDYGHPADWVIEVLENSGAGIKRTDRDGDVVIALDR